ncbi:MAG: hypothetical protein JXA73_07045 [Acidobacteria bacterium]|nr:hypothetical protein [Acidobacteriota bacterium]
MKDFKNFSPSDYFSVLWKRKWYALAGFILISGGVAIYSWRTPDVYSSISRIVVIPTIIPQDYVRPSDRSTPEEQIATIQQQVQSRTFLQGIIQDKNLFGYGSDRDFSMDEAINAVSRNIQIIGLSKDTFAISFSATDPHIAQDLTTRIVNDLIRASTSQRKTRALEADQFLDEQLRQTEQELQVHEEKIKQFKLSHLGELPEQNAANMNVLNGLNSQLAAVENALQRARDQEKLISFRLQEQKRLAALTLNNPTPQIQQDYAAPALEDPLLKKKQAELAALSLKYTPRHPEVVRLAREVEELKRQSLAESSSAGGTPDFTSLEAESNEGQAGSSGMVTDALLDMESAEIKIEAQAIQSEIAKREKERDSYLKQIRSYQAKLNLAPALEQAMVGLSREHEALKQQYANLQSKKFQAQMTANLEANRNNDSYKILDEANLPEKPSFPDRLQLLVMGLGAGLLLGIAAAFGRELLDTTLSNEDEVTAVLKLPVLATISEVPKKQPKRISGGIQIRKSA